VNVFTEVARFASRGFNATTFQVRYFTLYLRLPAQTS